MKKDVLDFVTKCMVCQKVKAEHQIPLGLLYDSVWVVVDRLTKSAHFLPVRTDYSLNKLVELYIEEIVWLHRILVSIISNRDPRFTSRFWGKLQEALGTQLNFSTAFHRRRMDNQRELFKF